MSVRDLDAASNPIARRTVINTAAWAAPVVAVAAAAPLAAASGELPEASQFSTGGSGFVVPGWSGAYKLEGEDQNADPALLPSDAYMVIMPDTGVTVEIESVTGGTYSTDSNGTITVTANGEATVLKVVFKYQNGTIGQGATFNTYVPSLGYAESFHIPLKLQ